MKPELAYYSVAPRLVRADHETSVVIRPLYVHAQLDPALVYRVSCYPCETDPSTPTWPNPAQYLLRAEQGALSVRHRFAGE